MNENEKRTGLVLTVTTTTEHRTTTVLALNDRLRELVERGYVDDDWKYHKEVVHISDLSDE